MRTRLLIAPMVTLAFALVSVGIAAQPEAPEDAVARPLREGANQFDTAPELLDALEQVDESLSRLSAQTRYTKLFAIAGDMQMRLGSICFAFEPRKMFAMKFDKLIVGEEMHDAPQEFVFDGQWFIEVYEDETPPRQVWRRMVPPGEAAIDPFDMEEGPFPLPIGQRRDVILERFDARLAPSDEGFAFDFGDADREIAEEFSRLLATPARDAKAGSWIQLVLTPKRGEEAPAGAIERDFDTLRMWYDPVTLLPRMGMSIEPVDGKLVDVKLIEFFMVRTNDEAADGRFDIEPPGDGWDVVWVDNTAVAP